MKKITSLLLFMPLIVSAQDFQAPDRAPANKYEISMLGGKALDMQRNFNIVGAPWFNTMFGSISVYRNFSRWQLGLGFEIDGTAPRYTTDFQLWTYTPQLQFNTTYEAYMCNFYAGVMAGGVFMDTYTSVTGTSSSETKASGIVAGIQAGVLFKVAGFLALNFELGARAAEIKYKSHTVSYGNIGPGVPREHSSTFGQSQFYIPFKAGLRFRF